MAKITNLTYGGNLDDVTRQLLNLKKIDLKPALAKACLIIENSAKEKCPVDTGILRNSITHQVQDETDAIVYTNIHYAPFVELGSGLFASAGDGRQTPWTYQRDDGTWVTTVGQHPQPFMVPAMQENATRVVEMLDEAVMEVVKKG